MSRAFVDEDSGSGPRRRFALPPRGDPGFDESAAGARLEKDGRLEQLAERFLR